MGKEKLEARQEKTKEKLEEKAKKKKEAKEKELEAKAAGEKPKEEKKPKKKVEIKKPKVSEIKGRVSYVSISPKIATEVCRAIKGKPVDKAKALLNDVIARKRAIRYYRYKKDTPHKPGKGFGAGRYPVKVSKYVLGVLENAVANATYLNLDPEKLYVKIARVERAVSKEKGGRYANVEIVVAEMKEEKKKEKKQPKKKVKK